MISFPNAKINIGLYITDKRQDGYHNLSTIFFPITACKDVLEITPSNTFELHTFGKKIAGASDNNLIHKAYTILANDFPIISTQPINASLYKNIPMGAGLGGGSSDGAFMLRLLNEYYQLQLSNEDLIAYALQLGSDCPFFILNTPCYATGRGELLQEVPLHLSAYSIQLICPEVHISTATAFSNISPVAAPIDLSQIHQIPIEDWRKMIGNDFEKNIFNHHPALLDIKTQLYNQGALYASLSGTGATVYGIFPKGQQASIQTSLKFESFFQP